MTVAQTKSGLFVAEDFNARRDRMRAWKVDADSQARLLQEELQKMDPQMEVDFVDPQAANNPHVDRVPGIIPGRWHIIRRNPGGVDAWFPIVGANKAYRDPELSIVEEMKKADLWRAGALQELKDREEKKARDLERQTALEKEQRQDEMGVAYRAAKRMNGDGGLYKRTDKR